MLSSFRVEWFKPFSELEVSHLAPITVIGGKNNCGKSSLLEAIFTFFDRSNPQALLRSLGWRGFSKLTAAPEFLFSHAFHDYDMDHDIVLQATYDGKCSALRFKYLPQGRVPAFPIEAAQEPGSSSSPQHAPSRAAPSDALGVTLSDVETGEELEQGLVYVDKGQLALSGNLSRTDLCNARYQSLRVRNSAAEDAQLFGQLDIEGGVGHLVEFTKQFFGDVRSLTSVSAGEGMIYADVGLPKKIPLPALGDGAVRLVSYYLCAFGVKPDGILLLDEVGSGIHHSQLRNLWQGLARLVDHFSCQIIATTHSYECLEAAVCLRDQLSYSDKFRYMRLDQGLNSREVQVVSYSLDELCAAIEGGWELR
jgi:hypothetical protein